MNEKYIVIGHDGEIAHSGDTFAECLKILREVEVVIHDEIKRKECEANGGTEDHSCDNLFEEW